MFPIGWQAHTWTADTAYQSHETEVLLRKGSACSGARKQTHRYMPCTGEPPGHDEFARRRGERRPSSLSQAGTPLAESRSADGSPQQPGSGPVSARAPGTHMQHPPPPYSGHACPAPQSPRSSVGFKCNRAPRKIKYTSSWRVTGAVQDAARASLARLVPPELRCACVPVSARMTAVLFAALQFG